MNEELPRFRYGLPDIYDKAPWSETDIEGLKALTGPLWRTPLRSAVVLNTFEAARLQDRPPIGCRA
jgi:hypothetical protein